MQYDKDKFRNARLVDVDGDQIGMLDLVFLDDQTGEPTFATVKEAASGASFVPLHHGTLEDGQIRVPYTQDVIRNAPHVDAERHLSVEQQDELISYYDGNRSEAGRSRDSDTRDIDTPASDTPEQRDQTAKPGQAAQPVAGWHRPEPVRASDLRNDKTEVESSRDTVAAPYGVDAAHPVAQPGGGTGDEREGGDIAHHDNAAFAAAAEDTAVRTEDGVPSQTVGMPNGEDREQAARAGGFPALDDGVDTTRPVGMIPEPVTNSPEREITAGDVDDSFATRTGDRSEPGDRGESNEGDGEFGVTNGVSGVGVSSPNGPGTQATTGVPEPGQQPANEPERQPSGEPVLGGDRGGDEEFGVTNGVSGVGVSSPNGPGTAATTGLPEPAPHAGELPASNDEPFAERKPSLVDRAKGLAAAAKDRATGADGEGAGLIDQVKSVHTNAQSHQTLSGEGGVAATAKHHAKAAADRARGRDALGGGLADQFKTVLRNAKNRTNGS